MRRVIGAGIVVSIFIGSVQAQPRSATARATADQLFSQGRALAKANRWAEACPKFEASLRYDPALGTRLNLAACYEHIGKLASAWGIYREAIELASRAGDIKRRNYAKKQAAALERQLPRLEITTPARPPAGFVATRDGVAIATATLGEALYVDPGPHEITASAPGFEAFRRTVTLAQGQAETIVIPDLVAVLPPTTPPSSTRKALGITVGAAGMAAVGLGFVFGFKARSTLQDAKALCGADLACQPPDYKRGEELIGQTRSNATTSTVLVAAGGAAIAAGVIVYLMARPAREREVARLAPVAHDHGAGLALTGGF